MLFKKQDLIFIAFPFVLTFVFLYLGYQLLMNQNTEASIEMPQDQKNVEILSDGDIEVVRPQVGAPERIEGPIITLPQNKAQLANVLKTAIDTSATVIYFSVPYTLKDDGTLELTGVHNSSKENILRWAKKSVSDAHKNNLQVVLALTLNATTTISDPVAFSQKYSEEIETWAVLASEYSVGYFSTGITSGHPVYSKLTPTQMAQLSRTVFLAVREKFTGIVGLGLCCSAEPVRPPSGFGFAVVIPTPEVTYIETTPDELSEELGVSQVFFYDRVRSRVVPNAPKVPVQQDVPAE